MRRFSPPWTVEKIAGGLKVVDANGQSLAYVYSREKPEEQARAVIDICYEHATRIAEYTIDNGDGDRRHPC
jgi:hypothetical protein